MSEHGSDVTVADGDLDRWGAAQRAGGSRHPGDLDGLLQRAHGREVRRRTIGATVAGAVVVAGVIAGVGFTRHDPEQVGTLGPAAGAPATTIADGAHPAPTSDITFDSSPPDAGNEVWALRISYDPELWSFNRYSRVLGVDEPAVDPAQAQAYLYARSSDTVMFLGVAGPNAEATVRSFESTLRGQPGIVSVEVGSIAHSSLTELPVPPPTTDLAPTTGPPTTSAVPPSGVVAPTTVAS